MDVVSSHSTGTGPIVHHELPTTDSLEAKLLVERDSASGLSDEAATVRLRKLDANSTITSSTQDNH